MAKATSLEERFRACGLLIRAVTLLAMTDLQAIEHPRHAEGNDEHGVEPGPAQAIESGRDETPNGFRARILWSSLTMAIFNPLFRCGWVFPGGAPTQNLHEKHPRRRAVDPGWVAPPTTGDPSVGLLLFAERAAEKVQTVAQPGRPVFVAVP